MRYSCMAFTKYIMIVMSMLPAITPTWAQNRQRSETVAIGLAYSDADTGRMRPRSDTDYTRYDHPAWCEQSVSTVLRFLWRRGEHDTLSYDVAIRDTLPTRAVAAGRHCARGKGFFEHSTMSLDMRGAYRLALAINDDRAAEAIVHRQYAAARNDSLRALVLLDAVYGYVHVHPVRIALAEFAMTRLDAMPESVMWQQLITHRYLVEHYQSLADPIGMKRHLDHIVTMIEALPPAAQERWKTELATAYEDLWGIVLAMYGAHAPQTDSFIARGERSVGQQFRTLRDFELQHLGIPFALPRIPYWFAPGVSPATVPPDSATTQVRPGRVTYVTRVDADCGQLCYDRMSQIRHMLDRYHERGLDVILLAKTNGYSTGTLTQNPDQEAESIRKYYQEYLKLPVIVGVEITPFTHLPSPDGRRMNKPTPSEVRYTVQFPFPGFPPVPLEEFVVDTHGLVQKIATDVDGVVGRTVIERLLAQ